MALEILELVVKASITDDTVKKENSNPIQQQIDKIFDKQLFMEEIIEQVCAIMEYKQER